MTPQSVCLFFREGGSDKVYNVQLEEANGLWSVRMQNGRRGKALTSRTKVENTSYEIALKEYEKAVLAKTKKGYTPDESGVAFSGTENQGDVTGFRPQLLNEISAEDARNLGDDWLVQQKHDGERRGLIHDGTTAVFSNRRGLSTAVQAPVAEAWDRLVEITGPMILDAEDMGDHVVIFDVVDHFMISNGTFRERASILANLAKTISANGLSGTLHVDVPTPASEFFATHADVLESSGAEGYVLRHADSVYEPGKPSSGGQALKVKFWADMTCRVCEGRANKNSVGIELLDENGAWTQVGNVTVPEGKKPNIGDLIDVKYLYAYEGGSLFQPSFKGVRTDIDPEECRIDRLKFKIEEPEEDSCPGL